MSGVRTSLFSTSPNVFGSSPQTPSIKRDVNASSSGSLSTLLEQQRCDEAVPTRSFSPDVSPTSQERDQLAPAAWHISCDSPLGMVYSSVRVSLPDSVSELVRCYEQSVRRCSVMRRCIDEFYLEANRLADVSPHASVALKDILSSASECAAAGHNEAGTGCGTKTLAASQKHPGMSLGVVQDGCVSSRAACNATIVTGRVVSATSTPVAVSPPSVLSVPSAVTTPEEKTTNRLTRFLDEMTRDYKKECTVLQLKLMTMQASQLLLLECRERLKGAESACSRQKKTIKALRDEVKRSREQCSMLTSALGSHAPEHLTEKGMPNAPRRFDAEAMPDANLETMQSFLAHVSDQLLHATDANEQFQERVSVLEHARAEDQYAIAQLEGKLRERDQRVALLEEANTQMEGQLQRILSSTLENQQLPSQCVQHAAFNMPVSSEQYNAAAMEVQLTDLRNTVDTLTRERKRQALLHDQLEAKITALMAENSEIRGDLLQYRRHTIETELNAEQQVSVDLDADRVRVLEKEALRLRHALKERKSEYDSQRREWDEKMRIVQRLERVRTAAEKQLLTRLFALQVKCMMHEARQTNSVERRGTQTQSSNANLPLQESRSAVATTATRVPHANAPGDDPIPGEVCCASQKNSNCPVSQHEFDSRSDPVDELRHAYERKLQTLETQGKAEAKRLQQLNQQLRLALSASQEELARKSHLLDKSARHHSGNSRNALLPLTDPQPSSSTSKAGGGGSREPVAEANTSTLDAGLNRVACSSSVPSHSVASHERRYDPDNMTEWEAIQVENEVLLQRLSVLQQDKWSLTAQLEDYQCQCQSLHEEVQRITQDMQQRCQPGNYSYVVSMNPGGNAPLRSLQTLLQEALTEKIRLEEQVKTLKDRVTHDAQP